MCLYVCYAYKKNIEHHLFSFQYALPHIRKVKGNVIMTGSIGGVTGQPGATPYCATKVKSYANIHTKQN